MMTWGHSFRVLVATLRLSLANQFRYPVEWITQTISNLGLLLLLAFGAAQTVGADKAQSLVASLLFSWVAMAGMQGPVRYLENKSGDLEDIFLTPVPAPVLLFCHAAAQLLLTSINIVVCYGALMLLFHAPAIGLLRLAQGVLPVFLGMLGFGYLLAGLQILFKRLGALVNLLSAGLLALAFAPAEWLAGLAWVSPYASGLLALSGSAAAAAGAYLLGLVQLAAGLVCFQLAQRAMVRLGWSGVR